MPRQARVDAPNTLHHVVVRGIERRTICRDDPDRADFVARLARLPEQGALTIYAWALLPNHAHLLVRTGPRPLAAVLGLHPAVVYQAARRRAAQGQEWEGVLAEICKTT